MSGVRLSDWVLESSVRFSGTESDFLTPDTRLTCPVDMKSRLAVSTTVGSDGEGYNHDLALVGRPEPAAEQFVLVLPETCPRSQAVEVGTVDRQQGQRIARQVPVSLAEGLNAHPVELAVERGRE